MDQKSNRKQDRKDCVDRSFRNVFDTLPDVSCPRVSEKKWPFVHLTRQASGHKKAALFRSAAFGVKLEGLLLAVSGTN